jgi:hypothetical protein
MIKFDEGWCVELISVFSGVVTFGVTLPLDQILQGVKLLRGLGVRLECFQVMAIVWERHKMLPAELR